MKEIVRLIVPVTIEHNGTKASRNRAIKLGKDEMWVDGWNGDESATIAYDAVVRELKKASKHDPRLHQRR